MKSRLDVLLAEKGLAKSRSAAQTLIKSGCVLVNGKPVMKPSDTADDEADTVELRGAETVMRYVGRGGFKLERAIEFFGIDLRGRVCLDIGASTGGFTDCMLQHGAARVYAVDVGHGQLAQKLLDDPRVISLEGLDIRAAGGEIAEPVDLVGIDVSFISLKLILPEIRRFTAAGAECAALIKPQFEQGGKKVGKKGVIRDKKEHLRVVEDIRSFAEGLGFSDIRTTPSPIEGGDGNREFLIYFKV